MSLVSDLIRLATYLAILGAFAFAGYRLYQEYKTVRKKSEPKKESAPKEVDMFCISCRGRMYEYHVDPRFLEGEFYYCGEYPEAHPWVWVKKNGQVVWKE